MTTPLFCKASLSPKNAAHCAIDYGDLDAISGNEPIQAPTSAEYRVLFNKPSAAPSMFKCPARHSRKAPMKPAHPKPARSLEEPLKSSAKKRAYSKAFHCAEIEYRNLRVRDPEQF